MLPDAAILGIYAALFVPWAWLIARSEDKPLAWPHLIGVALMARLVLVCVEPILSDDIFRYVWDGRVAHAGINPYSHAPASEALAHLRDPALWPKINHPDVPTIYPPVAQLLFWLNAALGGGTTLLRLLLVLVEAAGVGFVGFLLTRTRPRLDEAALKRAFVTYALCPLVVVEVAWSGHVDVLAWMPLAAALVLMVRAPTHRAAAGAGVLFGVSIAAKFLGLLALPLVLLAPRASFERSFAHAFTRRASFVAIAAMTVAASYVPYADAGKKLFAGFGTYASSWQGNDGPFRAATTLAEWQLDMGAGPDDGRYVDRSSGKLVLRYPEHDDLFEKMGWTRTWQDREVPATSFAADQVAQTIAKIVAAFVVGLAMLWAVVMRRDPIAATLVVLMALFFVAPVVHPWYVAWLVPLAALRRSNAALVFAFVVLAAYVGWALARAGGGWAVPNWVVAVEFGVVGLVSFWEAVGLYRDRTWSM